MPLTQLRIHGYRGFKIPGVLDLAVPNGNLASGLTILTGPNNGGKSTILECLRAASGHAPPSFSSGTRNKDVERVDIVYVVDEAERAIRSVTKGSSETTHENFNNSLNIFVVPSRKTFSAYFGKNQQNREQFIRNGGLPPQRSSVLSGFESRLFQILQDPTAFNTILARVLGYSPEWTIDRDDQGSYFLKFFNAGHSHSSDGMGEGLVSVFAIVDSLYDSAPGSVIAIDEPELSLHPALQKRTAALIEEYAADRQIIISTHSPYFVSLLALTAGGHLARISTGSDGTSIRQLSSESKDAIGKLASGNRYNPHVFGLDGRELFFQEDQIILTEGQEDVLLLPYVAQQLKKPIRGNFFGWGAGGASNIAHLCRILSDLGFKKVAAFLDADKAEEAASLSKLFTDYWFRCIPARDVRTKPPRKATEAVNGLLDEKLILRSEFSVAAGALLDSLTQHMSS